MKVFKQKSQLDKNRATTDVACNQVGQQNLESRNEEENEEFSFGSFPFAAVQRLPSGDGVATWSAPQNLCRDGRAESFYHGED